MTDHSFAVDGPVLVRARIRASDLYVAASDTDAVTVRLTPVGNHADAAALADATTVDLDGRTLRIDVPSARSRLFGGSSRLRIDVTVPTASDLEVESGSGDVLATGSYGQVTLRSGSGDVEVRNAREVEATTGSGDIVVGTAVDVRAVCGSGDIRVGEATGSLSAKTGSGDVVVDAAARLDAATGSGDVQVKEVSATAALRSGSGDLTVRSARDGEVVAKSASGDVVVGVPAGTAAMLDCSSVSGTVRSQLEAGGAPAEGEGAVVLRLRSVSGDVTVRRA